MRGSGRPSEPILKIGDVNGGLPPGSGPYESPAGPADGYKKISPWPPLLGDDRTLRGGHLAHRGHPLPDHVRAPAPPSGAPTRGGRTPRDHPLTVSPVSRMTLPQKMASFSAGLSPISSRFAIVARM